LPGEDPERRILDPILLIEGTSEPVVVDAARIAAKEARATNSDVGIMRMMWRLHQSEISSRQKGA
jgi:hypothetical protein